MIASIIDAISRSQFDIVATAGGMQGSDSRTSKSLEDLFEEASHTLVVNEWSNWNLGCRIKSPIHDALLCNPQTGVFAPYFCTQCMHTGADPAANAVVCGIEGGRPACPPRLSDLPRHTFEQRVRWT